MPFATIAHSPFAGGPAEIHYREHGSGVPLIFLHGGWGYEIYPIDVQADALRDFRLLIPDRSGYGRSTKPAIFGTGMHRRATEETLRFLDALGISQCIFWGHSDGAVIAAWLGLTAPERCLGLILEAFHYDREKRHSREFFTTMASNPGAFGARIGEVLRREHGEPYWQDLLRSEGQTWLDLAGSANSGARDLFDGKLSQLRIPTAFIHGSADPRTEPGELELVRRELSGAAMHIIEGGGHSPHSENGSAAEFGRALREALRKFRT